MNTKTIVAVILVTLGIVVLAYSGITFKTPGKPIEFLGMHMETTHTGRDCRARERAGRIRRLARHARRGLRGARHAGRAVARGVPAQRAGEVLRDLTSGAGFVRYAALRDGQMAGAASLCVSGGVAQLAGAATRPEHRRRGAQSAMLATRLACAAEAGCDIAVITTQPGSKSQENSQRHGFELLYTRAVLVRSA